jgi:hypothetical protein
MVIGVYLVLILDWKAAMRSLSDGPVGWGFSNGMWAVGMVTICSLIVKR